MEVAGRIPKVDFSGRKCQRHSWQLMEGACATGGVKSLRGWGWVGLTCANAAGRPFASARFLEGSFLAGIVSIHTLFSNDRRRVVNTKARQY